MSPPYLGSCLCGQVKFQLTAEPLTFYACPARIAGAAQEVRCFCQCGYTANRSNCWKATRFSFRQSPTTGENERTRYVLSHLVDRSACWQSSSHR